uniref:Uncharacterized protein n=1 Tax=Anopheles albimanus TaxID=7167 RepID=A0A182F864_ANOAL
MHRYCTVSHNHHIVVTLFSQDRSAPSMGERLKSERTSSSGYKKDSEMVGAVSSMAPTPSAVGANSSSVRISTLSGGGTITSATAAAIGGGVSLSPYGLSPHSGGSCGGGGGASSASTLGQPYASDASGFGPIYHHHHHHHHHNPLVGAPTYMAATSSFVEKYKLGSAASSTSSASSPPPPPPPLPPPGTPLTPPHGASYSGHYQGHFYAAGTSHHTMSHGRMATVASIACRERSEHAWYP